MGEPKKLSTEQKIVQSFKKLSATRPIEKITIQEITEDAGVIRTTFYNHFEDKYDLIAWIIDRELLEPIRPLIGYGMVEEAIELVIRNVAADKEFYGHLVRMEEPGSFMEIGHQSARDFLSEVFDEMDVHVHSSHRWLTKDVIAHFYGYSLTFVMVEWVRTGMIYTPKEMAEAYVYILSTSLEDVVGSMRNTGNN